MFALATASDSTTQMALAETIKALAGRGDLHEPLLQSGAISAVVREREEGCGTRCVHAV